MPDSVLRQVGDPDYVLKLWDLIVGGEMELAQIPQPFYRPQRMVIDEHIGGGFMHSGYPIMIHHSPSRNMLSADVIANPDRLMQGSKGGANWGFFHEIGHNMQNNDWVFGGTTEVSCNFFSLYMFDRLCGGRDNAHTGISNQETQKAMIQYFAAGPAYAKWQQNPFLGLIMFRQLQEAFGWETYKKFFREYQAMAVADPTGAYARGDQMKRDLWASTFSKVSGRNIAPFFEKWGIPISDDVEKELSALPGWMPFNFPPE
ncbi:M60 family metallopeptidase [Chitinophaga pollutisoli]|uniref:M60 family metallopeptidase n=1 Tax=Chitinophaga pollutisoli TaxID=3133966 RepID=A0ABZ2YXT0_9BACT